MRPPHSSLLTPAARYMPSSILMTASPMSATQVQEDPIPFGLALGLSLGALVPAVSRLWGYRRVPNLTRWHLLICYLSPVSSVSLFAIVVSKVYEKYHGPYLGLILVNAACSALYEVEYFRSISRRLGKFEQICIVLSICIVVLVIIGFVLCFFKTVPLWIWESLLFATSSGVYILLPLGYMYLNRDVKTSTVRFLMRALCIPCACVLLYLFAFIRRGQSVFPAWVFYIMSSFCTVRFQIISSSRARKVFGIGGFLPGYNRFSTGPNRGCQVALVSAQPSCDPTEPLWQWEKGVLELLKSTHDVEMIRKICRLPFRARDTLQDVLSRRWNPELDLYLMSLRVEVKDHREEIFDWPRDLKAKEFLKLVLRTRRKPPPVWNWAWDVLDSVTGSRSPSQIADTVSEVMNTAVLKVEFREWAGCAFGCDEQGVTSCFNGVEHSRNILRQQLQKFDQLKTNCESVEKELHSRDPLACWLFSNSLELRDCQPNSAFESFFHSILNVFYCEDPALLVRRFAFLETRFAIMAEDGGAWRSFSFDVSLLERITHEEPKALAESITNAEREFFLGLTPEDFEETEAKTLCCHLDATRSSTLANDIIACFSANGLLLRHVIELVKHLHLLRNYNSEAAILTALQKAQILPPELSTLSRVINSDNRYASYFELWFKKPGLPYLHAHFQARLVHAGSKSEFLQKIQGLLRAGEARTKKQRYVFLRILKPWQANVRPITATRYEEEGRGDASSQTALVATHTGMIQTGDHLQIRYVQ